MGYFYGTEEDSRPTEFVIQKTNFFVWTQGNWEINPDQTTIIQLLSLSISSGAYVLNGMTAMRTMLKLQTITEVSLWVQNSILIQ